MSLPAETRAPAARWRGALPPDFVDALSSRPLAAAAFERLSLFEIRSVVRWVQSGDSAIERRRRVKKVLASLAPPDRRPPAA